MASRSTRNKLKHQAHKMIENCDNIQGHLQFTDVLADGKSDYITENLSLLVTVVDMLKDTLVKFRSGL